MDLENEVVNYNNDEESDIRYCRIAFENKYMSTKDNPVFNGKTYYEYKTNRKLEEGQVLKIQSKFGEARVLVVDPNVGVEDIQFSGGPDSLVELEILEG